MYPYWLETNARSPMDHLSIFYLFRSHVRYIDGWIDR